MILKYARVLSRDLLPVIALLSIPILPLRADGPVPPPLLEIASGLPGKQVRLTWQSETGVRYVIEKSENLQNGGPNGWRQVALVRATGVEAVWLDPEPTTTKCFYRVMQPVSAVYSISPPLLSTSGGVLMVNGQLIPAGSSLVLNIDGLLVTVPLFGSGAGLWEAVVGGPLIEGASVTAVGITNSVGATIVTLNVPITVTATGLALDGPPSLPPGAPVPQASSNPIPGVGIVVKRNPGTTTSLRTGQGSGSPFGGDTANAIGKKMSIKLSFQSANQDTIHNRVSPMSHSDQFVPEGMDASSSALIAAWLSKKGYDYYQAQSALSSAGAHSNPAFQNNGHSGVMPSMKRGYDYYKVSSDNAASALQTNPYFVSNSMQGAMQLRYEGKAGLSGRMKKFMPGEVNVPISALSLECPVGPNIDWVCTYRSTVPTSSAHGPGWDFSYNISIEPLPPGAGATASRVAVRDGQGRRDIYHRQADGSYRCDGLFREGRFDGDVFTLTFADKGKWVFGALSSRTAPRVIILITDGNNNRLTCAYDSGGNLASVTSDFGQSISVTRSAGRITGITDHTGRSVSFGYYGPGDPGGEEGVLSSISCPQEVGQPPAAGPVSFTYSTGNLDARLNGNLLSATDGAGRTLGAFTYSPEANPLHLDYDTCSSVQRFNSGHVMHIKREPRPTGGYTEISVDEVGRVTETDFDIIHRDIATRQYTGFSTPNVPVTSTTNRPTGKLRSTDPDYFETTCSYNADSLCTTLTHPDGSKEIITYDREFRADCPVREGGNPRVMTLRTPGGEDRTVTCDYLAGFGTLEPLGHEVVAPRDQNSGQASGKIAAGVIAAIVVAAIDPSERISRPTRTVSAHGQATTFDYDTQGNLTSVITSLPTYGMLYQYAPDGRLSSSTTLNGPGSSFVTTYNYNAVSSFLSSVVCDSGGLNLTTSCVRDALGRVTSIVDPRGNNEIFTYNALDQITSHQSPPVPQRITTSYHYDSGGSLARCDVEHRDETGALVSTNPAYSSFLVYNNHGLLVRTASEERPVDATGLLVPDTLGIANFATCDITLNNAGECVRLSTPAACRAQTSDLVCDFTYDELGMIHRVHDGGTGNTDGLVTECDYDLFGAMTRCAVSGQGVTSVETCTYDGFHRVSTETDAMGNVCSYDYDNKGYVTCSVFGEVNDVAGSSGNVLLFRMRKRPELLYQAWDNTLADSVTGGHVSPLYDDASAVHNPMHGEEGYRIHKLRTRVEVLKSNKTGDPNANRTNTCPPNRPVRCAFFGYETEDDTITCDRFTPGGGPVTQEITTIDRSPAGLVQQISCNGDVLATMTYDTAGRENGYLCGHTSHFLTLNPNGQVTSSTRTDTCPSDALQTKTFTHSHTLDALGRVTQSTDGTGNVSSCTYDSLSRPLSMTEPGGLVTRYAYDGSSPTGPFSEEVSADAVTSGVFVVLSRSLERCGELRSTTDSYGHTTTFSSDALGRETRCDFPDGTFETQTYRHLGNEFMGHLDLSRTTLTCDLNGRPLTSLTTSNPNVLPITSTPLRSFTHDGLNRCTSVSLGTQTVSNTYDSLGNVISETQGTRVVTSTYDHRGRTSFTYPNGDGLLETRDAQGLLSSVAPNAALALRAPAGVTHEYHRSGHRVIRSVQGNGIVTTYQYRGDGEAALPGSPDFTFDDCVKISVGNLATTFQRRDRSQLLSSVQTTFATGAAPPSRTQSYTRNRLGDITTAATRVREIAGGQLILTSQIIYTLDLEGRRLTATGGENPGTYTQNPAIPPGDQQMGQYTTWPLGSLAWDDDGNLTSMATATDPLSFTYDVEGRLSSISRGGMPLISYAYDPLGRCISRDPHAGPATTFIYDGDECIQELGEDGLPDLTHFLADGIRQCMLTRNDTIYYPQSDCTTNSLGAVVEHYDFDDAGKPIFLLPSGLASGATQSSISLRWLTPGAAWEPEIGMFHCGDSMESPQLNAVTYKAKQGKTGSAKKCATYTARQGKTGATKRSALYTARTGKTGAVKMAAYSAKQGKTGSAKKSARYTATAGKSGKASGVRYTAKQGKTGSASGK